MALYRIERITRTIHRMNSNMTSINKQQILQEFLNKHKDLPKQGSSEWLNQRKLTVGGSQIATLMGVNKYENVRSFVKTKMDMYSFKKEAPLWFGNLMEPCIEQFVEIEYNTKTYETGSLPCEFNNHLSYSPDGLCIISKDKLKKVMSKEELDSMGSDKESVILLEFKSPFMRKIKYGEVPEYYIPQPLLGMEIIDIAEASIFIECVFRFCSYSDLFNNKYSYYHYDKVRYEGPAIMYSGISLFYKKENKAKLEDIINSIDEFKYSRYGCRYKEGDLSSISDRNTINKIMELATDSSSGEKILESKYHSMYSNRSEDYEDENSYTFHMYNNSIKFVNELQEIRNTNESDDYIYLGTLCYKLLDVNQVPIMKKNILDDSLNEKIIKVFDIVKETSKKLENTKSTEEFEKQWKILSKDIPTKL